MDTTPSILRRPKKKIVDKNHTFGDTDYLKEVEKLHSKKAKLEKLEKDRFVQLFGDKEQTSYVKMAEKKEAERQLQEKKSLRSQQSLMKLKQEQDMLKYQQSVAERERQQQEQKRMMAKQIAMQNAKVAEAKRKEKIKAKMVDIEYESHNQKMIPSWGVFPSSPHTRHALR